MKKYLGAVPLVLLLCLSFGCQDEATREGIPVGTAERAKIVSEVTAAMHSYEDAVRKLDVERIIEHFAKESEFRVCFDNQVSDYDTLVSQVRKDFASMGTPLTSRARNHEIF